MSKGELRGAAERIERGISHYAEGDLNASLADFEEALRVCPGHERALACRNWVKDVVEGRHSIGAASDSQSAPSLDESSVRAVSEALAYSATALEIPSWEPATRSAPSSRSGVRTEVKPSQSGTTIHGMNPVDPTRLTPNAWAGLNAGRAEGGTDPIVARAEEGAESGPVEESVTREWQHHATSHNLPPLDVPELTDEQIAGLVALEGGSAQRGRFATSPSSPRGRTEEDDQAPMLVEMEAEPTPVPNRLPGMPSLRAISSARVAESPDEGEPFPDLNLLPLEAAPYEGPEDPGEEPGSMPTNPFIKGPRLNEYATYGQAPAVEDLPQAPPAANKAFEQVEAALQQGDASRAFESSELAIDEAGGLEGPGCRGREALLGRTYEALLGGLDRVPQHGTATPNLEPRSAFLLSRLDGSLTVEDILDVSGMPRLEALRVLSRLVHRGVVVLK